MDSFKWNAENITHHPDKIRLDAYEKEILDAYESGRLKPSSSGIDFQSAARNTMKKKPKNKYPYIRE